MTTNSCPAYENASLGCGSWAVFLGFPSPTGTPAEGYRVTCAPRPWGCPRTRWGDMACPRAAGQEKLLEHPVSQRGQQEGPSRGWALRAEVATAAPRMVCEEAQPAAATPRPGRLGGRG